MNFRIPEKVETDRTILRMFKNSDWRDLHEYYSDKECVQYTVGQPKTEPETWHEVAIRTGHWLLHGYGPYAVEEKSSGKTIGIVGPWYPLEWPEPEITWHLVKSHWGKGLAKESVKMTLKITAEYLPEISFISLIHPNNIASVHLAMAVSATYEKTIQFRSDSCNVYRHRH
jgi:RimJ/RimL family protein N-acetyltransferase